MSAHGSLESKAFFSRGGGAAHSGRLSEMLWNGGELNGKRILGRKTIELMTSDHSMDFEHGEDLSNCQIVVPVLDLDSLW